MNATAATIAQINNTWQLFWVPRVLGGFRSTATGLVGWYYDGGVLSRWGGETGTALLRRTANGKFRVLATRRGKQIRPRTFTHLRNAVKFMDAL